MRCTCHDTLIVKNLNRWFKEKWVDVSRKDPKTGKHPPCGRSKAKKGSKGYPKCRPSVRVSSKTPKTSGEMTSGQKRAATKRKRAKKQGVGGKPTIVKATFTPGINCTQCGDPLPPDEAQTVIRYGITPMCLPCLRGRESMGAQPEFSQDFQNINTGEPMDLSWRLLKERKSKEAFEKKKQYDTKYHSTPERKEYRRKLAVVRRKRGVMGKGGNDMSHAKNGKIVSEKPSANRARHFKGKGTLK